MVGGPNRRERGMKGKGEEGGITDGKEVTGGRKKEREGSMV